MKKKDKKKESNLFWIILLVITHVVYLYQINIAIEATDVVVNTIENYDLTTMHLTSTLYSIFYIGIAYAIAFIVRCVKNKKKN